MPESARKVSTVNKRVWKSTPALKISLFHLFLVVDCGGLQPPENGNVTLSDTTIGSQANYSCNTGFTLTGIATRECLESGEWNNSAPTCERELVQIVHILYNPLRNLYRLNHFYVYYKRCSHNTSYV